LEKNLSRLWNASDIAPLAGAVAVVVVAGFVFQENTLSAAGMSYPAAFPMRLPIVTCSFTDC
jgi:hypothetical protein